MINDCIYEIYNKSDLLTKLNICKTNHFWMNNINKVKYEKRDLIDKVVKNIKETYIYLMSPNDIFNLLNYRITEIDILSDVYYIARYRNNFSELAKIIRSYFPSKYYFPEKNLIGNKYKFVKLNKNSYFIFS